MVYAYEVSVCVPVCAELEEALDCLAKAPASEITLAMTGEDSTVPVDLGGEETVGRRQRGVND